MKRTACYRQRLWSNLNYYTVTYIKERRKVRNPVKYNKQCSRYSGLKPGLVEFGERVLTHSLPAI